MVMQSLRKGSSGGFLKYILFGILGMSVGGLVVMDVTGVFKTGGLSGTDVAEVEGKAITIQQFDRNVRRSLSRYNIPVEQAYKMGIIDELLSSEIRSSYLTVEAENLGIKVGKDHLAKEIAEVVRPQMQEGETLQDTLNRILTYQRVPESAFVSSVEREATGNILMETVIGAVKPSRDNLAKALFQFQNQTRDIEFVAFLNKDISDYEKPTDKQIESMYESVKRQKYQTPEYRASEIIVFDPKFFDVNVEVSDDEALEYYADNKNSYAIGEQYVVSQIMVTDEGLASEIYKEVESGKSLQEIATSELGKSAQYSEDVPFEVDMMMPEFLESLSAIKVSETTKPFKTMLGYHIAQLNEIRAPHTPSYDVIKSKVMNEIKKNKKADALYEIVTKIDGEIADGLSFEDIKAKYEGAEVISTEFVNAQGLGKDASKPLEEHFDGASAILIAETLFENVEDDASPLIELDNGKFVSVKVSEKQNADFIPLSEVRDEVEQGYIADIQSAENEIQTRKFLAEVETSQMPLKDLAKSKGKALQSLYGIGLSGDISAPLQQSNLPTLFKASPGQVGLIEIDGGYALFNITDFKIPEANNETNIKIEEVKASLVKDTQDEAFLMYLRMLDDKYVAKINKALLDQVYGKNTGGE